MTMGHLSPFCSTTVKFLKSGMPGSSCLRFILMKSIMSLLKDSNSRGNLLYPSVMVCLPRTWISSDQTAPSSSESST